MLNIAKYKAMVRDTQWYWVTAYPITAEEYSRLKVAIEDKLPFAWIHDIDWNRIREINPKRDIKEFAEIIYNTEEQDNVYWICEYWVRHKVLNWKCSTCYCFDKLWIHPEEYFNRLGKLWYKGDKWTKLYYPRDITNEIIRKYKETYFVEWKYT